MHIADSIEDFGLCRGFWQFPMERLCGMLIPLINSRKLPYINLNNNVLLQERFKYLRFLPIFDKKVFSNFEGKKENTWPIHRVYSNELYYHKYEFYSPSIGYILTKYEIMRLKAYYAAILQKDTYDIEVICNFYNF